MRVLLTYQLKFNKGLKNTAASLIDVNGKTNNSSPQSTLIEKKEELIGFIIKFNVHST